MRNAEKECAAMAAAMLDAELLSIIRRLQSGSLTTLQRAVCVEARKRNLISNAVDRVPVIVPGRLWESAPEHRAA